MDPSIFLQQVPDGDGPWWRMLAAGLQWTLIVAALAWIAAFVLGSVIGVARTTDRAWLVRWLKTPDEMLAKKDPIATQLFEQYKQVVMPNLKLTDVDVNALIEYLETESRRVEGAKRNPAGQAANALASHGGSSGT